MIEVMSPTMRQPHALTALEAMPADLRLLLGWRRLFALALDSVMATTTPETLHAPGRTPILLTLATYCYASNLVASEDIESACAGDADLAHIAGREDISAAELRQFRRHNRTLIEGCLQNVFGSALREFPEQSPADCDDVQAMAEAIYEFTQRRLNLAVLFDKALSE